MSLLRSFDPSRERALARHPVAAGLGLRTDFKSTENQPSRQEGRKLILISGKSDEPAEEPQTDFNQWEINP